MHDMKMNDQIRSKADFNYAIGKCRTENQPLKCWTTGSLKCKDIERIFRYAYVVLYNQVFAIFDDFTHLPFVYSYIHIRAIHLYSTVAIGISRLIDYVTLCYSNQTSIRQRARS